MQVQGYCKWQVAYLRIRQRFCWCLQMLAGQYIHILQSPRCVLCHSHSSCVICVNQKLYVQGYVLPETAITGDPEHIEPINPYPPVPSFLEMSSTIWWYLLCTLFLCQLVFSSLFWWSRCNATHLKARPKGGGEQSQPQLLQTLTNLRASEIQWNTCIGGFSLKCAGLPSYMLSNVAVRLASMQCASWVTFRKKECLGAAAKFLFGTTGMAIGVSWRFWFAITVCVCVPVHVNINVNITRRPLCLRHGTLQNQAANYLIWFALLSNWRQKIKQISNRLQHIQTSFNF